MSNYRNEELKVFDIKNSLLGKIRLFFIVLTHPWVAVQVINEFMEECGKLQAGLTETKLILADRTEELADAKMEISRLKEESRERRLRS